MIENSNSNRRTGVGKRDVDGELSMGHVKLGSLQPFPVETPAGEPTRYLVTDIYFAIFSWHLYVPALLKELQLLTYTLLSFISVFINAIISAWNVLLFPLCFSPA